MANINTIKNAVETLSAYRGAVERTAKDGTPIVEGLAKRWAEALFTNEQKTVAIKDAYSLENILRNTQDDIMHPCAVRYVLYQLMEEFKQLKGTRI